MIIRRDTLNAISEMKSKNMPAEAMARLLNLAVSDVVAAIKAFKL